MSKKENLAAMIYLQLPEGINLNKVMDGLKKKVPTADRYVEVRIEARGRFVEMTVDELLAKLGFDDKNNQTSISKAQPLPQE